MNKKGVFKIMNWAFFRMLFITVAFFTVWIFTVSQIQGDIDIQDTRNAIFVKRALFSPTSFPYTDPDTGRVYPGIIDIDKFTDKQLNESFDTRKSNIAAKFEVTYGNNKKIAYIDKKSYERWAPLSSFDQYNLETRWRYVLVRDKGSLEQGALRIDVVVPNE